MAPSCHWTISQHPMPPLSRIFSFPSNFSVLSQSFLSYFLELSQFFLHTFSVLSNSKCKKPQDLKFLELKHNLWQNSKTKFVMQHKKSNWQNTKIQLWKNQKNNNCDKTQWHKFTLKSIFDKSHLVRTIWHLTTDEMCSGQPFAILQCFC